MTPEDLCRSCKWEFKRAFIPAHPEEFEDENGNKIKDSLGGVGIALLRVCILSELDLDMDITVECSHYEPLGNEEE
jgi:hypothetical protein